MLVGQLLDIPGSVDALLTPPVAALLDRLDVASHKLREGTLPGERRSKRRGQSVEFDDFRPYVVGDDLRHLDWNAFARFDRFIIKLFRAEEDLAVVIVLDESPSMRAGEDETAGGHRLESKLVHAARLTMGLGAIALAKQNRLSVIRTGAGPKAEMLPPCRGRRSIERLGRFLLDGLRRPHDPGRAVPEFTQAMRAAGRVRTGRGVVILLSDLLVRGDITPGLRAFIAADRAGTDGAVLRVLSPAEIDPATHDSSVRGDLRLEDAEGGPVSEVTVTRPLIRRYRQRFADHETELRRACARLNLPMLTCPTDQPVSDVLAGSMRRLGLLT